MADTDKAIVKKCEKLLEKLRELQAQTYAIAEEMQAVLGGRVGIGDKLKQLERDLSSTWASRYGSPYHWNYKQDRPAMKRLLAVLELPEIAARWLTYLRNDDPFYVKGRHGFGLFASQVNRFAGQAAPVDLQLEAPVSDCRHVPTCRSDQEHTRKRSAELRA